MQFGRVQYQGKEVFGVLEGDTIKEATPSPEQKPAFSEPIPLADVRILPPVLPTKIVGVGLNYHAHAQEMGKPVPDQPLLFLKPATTVIGMNDPIVLPPQSERVDYEGELAVVMGQRCRAVSPAQASQYILGYTCINDVTARDIQKHDVQYTRAKSFDGFAPVGPFLVTEIDPTRLALRTYVNGEVKQEGNTSDMVFSVNELVAFISSVMTLLPGDMIATGTPPGVGPMQNGDKVEVEIEGLGRLSNPVVTAGA